MPVSVALGTSYHLQAGNVLVGRMRYFGMSCLCEGIGWVWMGIFRQALNA